MFSFADLNNHVQAIKDLILSDLQYDEHAYNEETLTFGKHLYCTKFWFVRISWANKKRYLFSLLTRVRSAWTISLLLQSLWNSRPKDAYLSASEPLPLSSFDQVPMDHDRTAIPASTLIKVVTTDRRWFESLDPQSQAMVLSELLTVAGGSIMWEVLKKATSIYSTYKARLIDEIKNSELVHEDKSPQSQSIPEKKEETTAAEKELNECMTVWYATLKALKESLKLEELELTFNNGTKKKMWKVHRHTIEDIETVDLVQLLPSSIGKRIISYLPQNQWSEYAKVNKYWAFLIEELKGELNARHKLDLEIDKIRETIFRHDSTSSDYIGDTVYTDIEEKKIDSVHPSVKHSLMPPSEKSTKYSLRFMLRQNKPAPQKSKPIRNLFDLRERLEKRGAVDRNLFSWCKTVLKRAPKRRRSNLYGQEGVLQTRNVTFPCPLLAEVVDLPLNPPLYKDPSLVAPRSLPRNLSNTSIAPGSARPKSRKKLSMWSKDFSCLIQVMKVPDYQKFD